METAQLTVYKRFQNNESSYNTKTMQCKLDFVILQSDIDMIGTSSPRTLVLL